MLEYNALGILIKYKPFLQIYLRLARKYNLHIFFFTPQDINWHNESAKGIYISRYGSIYKVLAIPKIIYNRLYPNNEQVVKQLISINREVYNQVTQFDKLKVYQVLSDSPLVPYLPQTDAFDLELLPKLLNDYRQLIIKPRLGNQGLNIWRLRLLTDELIALEHELPFPLILPNEYNTYTLINQLIINDNAIIQQWIDMATIDSQYFDLRVLLQKSSTAKWQITAVTSRIATVNQYLTNIYDQFLDAQSLIEQANISQNHISEIINLSMLSTSYLEQAFGHLAEICVDFVIDRNEHLWLMEVNSKPNKQLYSELADQASYHQAYLNPLLYGNYLHT